jgi:hypothetical protein
MGDELDRDGEGYKVQVESTCHAYHQSDEHGLHSGMRPDEGNRATGCLGLEHPAGRERREIAHVVSHEQTREQPGRKLCHAVSILNLGSSIGIAAPMQPSEVQRERANIQ